MSASNVIMAIVDGVREGGSTYHLDNGKRTREDGGFIVALGLTIPTKVIPAHKVSLEGGSILSEAFEFVKENEAELSREDRYFGTWIDERDGQMHLDVVQVVDSYLEAWSLAQERGELAFWDIQGDKEVRLPV
ncbi:hypothetical protein SEA_KEELAN_73 [Gordonia phage Keelan]|nr:hypothetical protein SEA_KEELAN_73 [Gordonia phage Keelan]